MMRLIGARNRGTVRCCCGLSKFIRPNIPIKIELRIKD